MTNGETIRNLSDKGMATLILCANCLQKKSCIGCHNCFKWRNFVDWLGEDVEVIECQKK